MYRIEHNIGLKLPYQKLFDMVAKNPFLVQMFWKIGFKLISTRETGNQVAHKSTHKNDTWNKAICDVYAETANSMFCFNRRVQKRTSSFLKTYAVAWQSQVGLQASTMKKVFVFPFP